MLRARALALLFYNGCAPVLQCLLPDLPLFNPQLQSPIIE